MEQRNIESLVEFVLNQVQAVQSGTFEVIKSDVVAAASLEAQLLLADILSSAEFEVKQRENDLDFLEAELATNIRTENREKKITEAQVKELISSKSEVREARNNSAVAHKEFKKWQYIFNTLKDSHIFFRNLNKTQ
jgi:DNA repair exonuclease SbcCD ATPase subunit